MDDSDAILETPFYEMRFSVRARKAFQRLEIKTLRQLVEYAPEELLSVRGCGVTTVNHVRELLAEKGLALYGDARAEGREG
jgi:DNA-directed RNA polymerase alpha subunit